MEGLEEVLFRVSQTEEDGSHLTALRDLAPGELIFSETAVATGPSDSQPVCIVCYTQIQENVCNRCWWPVCSDECSSSNTHQAECRLLSSCVAKAPGFSLPSHHLLNLRCLLLQNNARIWEQVIKLKDHGLQTPILSEKEIAQHPGFQDLLLFIREDCGMSVDLHAVLSVFLTCTTSSIVSRVADTEISGLYLQGGLLQHSCTQNTRCVFKGSNNRLYVYSSVPIKKGEKITHCRLEQVLNAGTLQRRKQLREMFIDCHCKRCCDSSELGTNSSGLLCQRCESLCSPLNPLNPACPWVCTNCGTEMSSDFVNTLLLGIQGEARECQESRFNRYKAFGERNKSILTEHHYLHTVERAKFFLNISSNSTVEEALLRIKVGKEILSIVDHLEPGLSIFRESVLVNLGTTLQLLLTQEILRRQEGNINSESLSDIQVYAGFRDAIYCFKEARKSAELEEDPEIPEKNPTSLIDENLKILQDMREYFESLCS